MYKRQWLDLARVKVTKKDKNSKVNLSGAVFGIYSDSACKNLLVDVYKRQGFLYYWKGIILIVTLLLSIIIYRPFCKYICPLGAIYSIFNPISIFRYRLDKDKCINCGKCKKVCQMNIDPVENCNHLAVSYTHLDVYKRQ